MIDPTLSLTFNLQTQQGSYALLLGSGVSRSAGIPTGWEVTLDLSRKLAHLQDKDCEPDPAKWYASEFQRDADYSELLSNLANTSSAQQQLLRAYFEPSEEEREEGRKLPTRAHHAIAELVRSGYVRVIVTTNFDRLLEAALEQVGIAPTVIASADAADGAIPLAHTKCTVVKVHGDYLDTRIKNSPDALNSYDERLNRLLDQIFDEYGLIVCGWSAEYDTALRSVFERARSRRYPMYWTAVSDPTGRAKELATLHNATVVRIRDADAFFGELLDNVRALSEFSRPHPLSTQAAVATLKRYLADDANRIRLRDLIMEETTRSLDKIEHAWGEIDGVKPDGESITKQVSALEAACETLSALFANGAFYDLGTNSRVWLEAFSMIAGHGESIGGHNVWISLRRYPALLLVYSSGIAALASDNFSVFSKLSLEPTIRDRRNEKEVPAPTRLYTHSVLETEAAKLLPGFERHLTPLSDRLFDVLREPLRPLIPDDVRYQRAFDRFEFLWSLMHVDQMKMAGETVWVPFGAYIWRSWVGGLRDWTESGFNCAAEVNEVIEKQNTDWPLLKTGFFGSSIDRLRGAFEDAQLLLGEIARRI